MGVADDRDPDRVDDTDVEVFERIPWESLENGGGDRRWVAYLVAGALVLGAVGVSLGRQAVPTPAPVIPSAEPTLPALGISDATAATSPAPAPASTSAPVTEEGGWAEADLMALAEAPVEVTGASVAEWFVTDHFTREGDDGGRSFVEWAGVVAFSWLDVDRATATVAMVRLATEGTGEYRRLPPEAWEVVLALDEDGWAVVDGPMMAEGGSPRIEISTTDEARATVESRWVDGAGLEWPVREPSGGSP
jgi:hypothetical protein